MSKVYKIHPGIGFARVGASEKGFFLPLKVFLDGAPFGLNRMATAHLRIQGRRPSYAAARRSLRIWSTNKTWPDSKL